MPLPILRYPLDKTGKSPNNLVAGEVRSLASNYARAVAPVYGAFYSDSLEVYDHSTGRLLVKGVDYRCVEMVSAAVELSQKDVMMIVLILDQSVSDQVRLNYQCVGGEYQSDGSAIAQLYNTVMMDNRPVDWSNVLNKQHEYTPGIHTHLLEDVFGFDAVVAAIERLRNAVVLSDVPAFETLIDWVNSRIDRYERDYGDVEARLRDWIRTEFGDVAAHMRSKDNPHEVSKEQLGLKDVVNYPVMTEEDLTDAIDTGEIFKKYITHEDLMAILSRLNLGTTIALTAETTKISEGYQLDVGVDSTNVLDGVVFYWSAATKSGTGSVVPANGVFDIQKDVGRFVTTVRGQSEIINDSIVFTVRKNGPDGAVVKVFETPIITEIKQSKLDIANSITFDEMMRKSIMDPGMVVSAKTLFYTGSKNHGDANTRFVSEEPMEIVIVNPPSTVGTVSSFEQLCCLFEPTALRTAASYFVVESRM